MWNINGRGDHVVIFRHGSYSDVCVIAQYPTIDRGDLANRFSHHPGGVSFPSFAWPLVLEPPSLPETSFPPSLSSLVYLIMDILGAGLARYALPS